MGVLLSHRRLKPWEWVDPLGRHVEQEVVMTHDGGEARQRAASLGVLTEPQEEGAVSTEYR